MVSAAQIKDELFAIAIPGKREVLSRFFKTGEGEYGAGDHFIGVTVAQQRELVKRYQVMPPSDIAILLSDEFHECRMIALLFLVRHYQKSGSDEEKKKIFNFYLNHTRGINNWDLVDLSAPYIVGDFLLNRNRETLYELIESDNIWEQRIAIVSTLGFIRKGDFADTFRFAERMETIRHDLLQKATGWMLREVGKRDFQQLYDYLKEHYKKMPRTTLRYAIERFEEPMRKQFLKGEI
jgi:3-methyladenine DNA glycosylase AlkD